MQSLQRYIEEEHLVSVLSTSLPWSTFDRLPLALLSIPSALTFSVILLLLSPILQTLSKATTSDSIWPLAGSLFFLDAILADYSEGDPAAAG